MTGGRFAYKYDNSAFLTFGVISLCLFVVVFLLLLLLLLLIDFVSPL